jgi:colanic acid/amylovoran biosynthesis glycosyltransferase
MKIVLHLERKFTTPTETFIANQINFINGYMPVVFTTQNLNNLKVNADIYSCESNRFLKGKILVLNQVKYFKDVYNNLKPSLIHSHFLTDAGCFRPFSLHLGIPKICSVYGYDVSSFPNRYMGFGKYYLKRVFREYDKFLAMSDDMARDLIKIGCPENKIIVHYHGIDSTYFVHKRDYIQKTLNILTISSLHKKKGHLTVLKALVRLVSTNPTFNFCYRIVGDGPSMSDLVKFVADNKLSEKVLFLGSIKYGKTTIDLLNAADLFVHPSMTESNGDKEGIPGAIVEAMASGLPVITTYHAGIPEIISDDINGILIKEKDDLALSEAILRISNDVNLRKFLGRNARQSAIDELDIRIRNKHLEEIYESLINKDNLNQS